MNAGLSHSDISAVVRLVREVCDRWDDPAGWREHLLHGACHLLGGNVGTMVTEAEGRDGRFGRIAVTCVVGLPGAKRALVEDAMSRMAGRGYADVSDNLNPGIVNLYGQIVRQGWVTAARGEITDDATYYAAPFYRGFRRHIDCDDYVASIRIVDVPRRPEAITIDRPHGGERFGPREVALLKLLHDEVAPLVGVRLATEAHLSRGGLSRRLNETLSLLLDGKSEKEAAAAMGLSSRTVHEYVTMLYEHFRVCSRAELLAYFVRREPAVRAVDAPRRHGGHREEERRIIPGRGAGRRR